MAGKRGTRTKDATPDILRRIAEGESLRQACKANGLNKGTFLQMCEKDKNLADQYARAKEEGLELLAEELLNIADDGRLDRTTRVGKGGEEYEVTDYDVIARSKLMVDTRRWLLSKLLPKKYGDKVDLTHAGPDGGKLEFFVRVDRDPGT